jgi:hypothetical protein
MPTEIEVNQDSILRYLYTKALDTKVHDYIPAAEIHQGTGLDPLQINQAVELLKSNGLIDWLLTLGSSPYTFFCIRLTARGAYEFQRRQDAQKNKDSVFINKDGQESPMQELLSLLTNQRPPSPIGSPYGFTDKDWEDVSSWKANKNVLYIVFGCKFKSDFCDYSALNENIKCRFKEAVEQYNSKNPGENIQLKYEPLHAGLGEHLFNEIARDIISSDISIFEISDKAPNVFIEIGVALTWGSRVFLIKNEKCSAPPSDISGQTYADYSDNGKIFADAQLSEKLYRMVERAIRKKG